MKERGILFRDLLVRRILVDAKTQTRRIVKPQPSGDIDNLGDGETLLDMVSGRELRCPYGVPGDRLWVREAWRSWSVNNCDHLHDEGDDCDYNCDQTYVAYRATPRTGFRPVPDRAAITYLDESSPIEDNRQLLGPWKPGIHLRRDHARITLDIKAIRVERLQDITEDDALAEGVELGVPVPTIVNGEPSEVTYFNARTAFAHLWCSVNGPDAWKSNPWVWVVVFARSTTATRVAA